MSRLFLSLPATLFDYEELQDEFNDLILGKWIPPQNLHLTLNFLGTAFERESVIQALSGLTLKAEPSDLKGLSLLSHNQILYARTANPSLMTLHEQIQEALGLPYEQEFIPHVTLMRIKKISDQTLFEERLRRYDRMLIGVLHPKVQLIQSHITPTGAHYSLLEEFETYPSNTDI